MGKCFNGKHLPSKEITVRCGKCASCRQSKGLTWASRIIQEVISSHEKGIHCEFITLTYNDKRIPRTFGNLFTLFKAQFRDFLKLQKTKHGPFRYYAVGEYGEMRRRPHYHLALFCESEKYAARFCEEWEKKYGHANRKPLIKARCGYLAKYTAKDLLRDKDKRLGRDQEPEFRISSTGPGLGYDFARMVANSYTSPKGRKLLDSQGDVSRTFRFQGSTYPLTEYTLGKIREILSIPELHRDRENHIGYLEKFGVAEAEINPEYHRRQEHNINEKNRKKALRNPGRL